MTTEARAPTVFISYSHDDREHKQWVLDLATKLRETGVDAIIDAWDLRPGDDFTKFMERGVRNADRVLMICTENYVAKANDGAGGVGYEAMIVTGELVRDLGTAKFIPVIRQGGEKPDVPTSVSTRLYINLSEGADVEAEFEKLLRELHQVPPAKPQLGRSPYIPAPSPAADDGSGGRSVPPVVATDARSVYTRALEVARANDVLEWRRVVRDARAGMQPILSSWWAKYATNLPGTAEELIEQSMEGVSAFGPLTAVALAGAASGNERFQHQTGLLEDVLNPGEWQRGGLTARVELPQTGAYIYQALYGAMCLNAGNLNAAMRLARTHVTSPSGTSALWQRHDIVMWPSGPGKQRDPNMETRPRFAVEVGMDRRSFW
jgi:hypothetical protein